MEIVQDMYCDKLCVIVEDSSERHEFSKICKSQIKGTECYPGVIVPVKDSDDKYCLEHRSTVNKTGNFKLGGVPNEFVPISFAAFTSWNEN